MNQGVCYISIVPHLRHEVSFLSLSCHTCCDTRLWFYLYRATIVVTRGFGFISIVPLLLRHEASVISLSCRTCCDRRRRFWRSHITLFSTGGTVAIRFPIPKILTLELQFLTFFCVISDFKTIKNYLMYSVPNMDISKDMQIPHLWFKIYLFLVILEKWVNEWHTAFLLGTLRHHILSHGPHANCRIETSDMCFFLANSFQASLLRTSSHWNKISLN